MTILVGIEKEKHIEIWADEMTSVKDSFELSVKLVKVGGMLLGKCGYVYRSQQLIGFLMNESFRGESEAELHKWWRDAAKWQTGQLDGEDKFSGLLATKLGLFSIEETTLVRVPKNSVTIKGSGADFARTALHLGRSPKAAVQAAIDLCNSCGGEPQKAVLKL